MSVSLSPYSGPKLSDLDVKEIESIIDSISETYHVEYDDYKHIHVSHGIIVLAKLGATFEEIEQYKKTYLEVTDLHAVYEPDTVITNENWEENFGTDGLQRYPSFLRYFNDLIAKNGWKEVIRTAGPVVLRGMVGGLFHGVIQTGMGIEGIKEPNVTMISEGLAWTANSYLGFSWSKGQILRKPGDSSSEFKELDPLSYMLETVTRAIKTDAFESTHALGKTPFYSNQHFHPVVKQIRLMSEDVNPRLVFHEIFNHSVIDLSQTKFDDLLELMSVAIATVYYCSKPEFYCLHAVTGWWALRFWLPYLDESDKHEPIANFLRSVLAVYIERGLPGVDQLGELLLSLRNNSNTTPLFETHQSPPKSHNWEPLLKKARGISDTHETKAIHALYEDWKQYGFRDVFYQAAHNHLTGSLYYNVDRTTRKPNL